MRSFILPLLSIATLATAQTPAGSATIVAVVAATNDTAANTQAEALANLVGRALQVLAVPRVFADQEALALAVSRGEVDFALMGPLAYLRVDPKAKTQLLFRTLRLGKGTYRSALFSGPTSKITSLEALKKEKRPLKIAWVETSSATGYVVPKAQLLGFGINPVQSFETQDFLGSHDAVCKAVLEGRYDVGATFSDPATNATKVTGCVGALGIKADTLQLISLSAEIPNDVLVAAPKLPRAKVDAVMTAVKAAAATKEGQATLKAALRAEGITDVKEEDFTPLRKALDTLVP